MVHLHDPFSNVLPGALRGRTDAYLDREIANHCAAGRAASTAGQAAAAPEPDPGERTRQMAEALAAEWVRRGPEAQITERDMRRAGFSQAEIEALGDEAIAGAHRILADLGRGAA